MPSPHLGGPDDESLQLAWFCSAGAAGARCCGQGPHTQVVADPTAALLSGGIPVRSAPLVSSQQACCCPSRQLHVFSKGLEVSIQLLRRSPQPLATPCAVGKGFCGSVLCYLVA